MGYLSSFTKSDATFKSTAQLARDNNWNIMQIVWSRQIWLLLSNFTEIHANVISFPIKIAKNKSQQTVL